MPILPEELMAKADLSQGVGLTGWRIPDFLNALEEARELGLACSSGEFEFRFEDGICELYWLGTGPLKERQSDEDWGDYVNRSASEIAESYGNLCRRADFDKEIEQWPFLLEKRQAGIDLMKHLWFVASFSSEDEYEEIRHRYWSEFWERLHTHKTREKGGKLYENYWKILHFLRLI